MSSAGTLLSDLEGKPPGGGSGNDDDLMRQILQDINAPSQGNMMQQQQGMPPPQVQSYKIQQPNAQSMYQQAADPAVPTAHMIGREHPNQADFAQMMMSSGQNNGGAPYQQQQQQQQQQQHPIRNDASQRSSYSGWKTQIFEELRQPILVAIIVLVLSLPAVNVLFSHYAPTLLRSGGDLNNMGLLIRAVIAGGVFWLFQRVIAPLMIG